MFDDTYIGIVIGFILGSLAGILIWHQTQSVESKTLITPTITINIHPDGTSDTTYIFTK
jgi:hypothetical protein